LIWSTLEARAEILQTFWFNFQITLILGDSTANGTEVTKQNSDNSNPQQWRRSVENDQGYFTLQNPISGKFLTASSSFDEDILMIIGKCVAFFQNNSRTYIVQESFHI
jgi:hypothetical protein